MLQLQQELSLLKEHKIKPVVIVPEPQTKLDSFLAKQPLDFTFVSDPKHILADKYGQEVKLLKLGRMPAQIVLNSELKQVYSHFAKSMADIVDEKIIISGLE